MDATRRTAVITGAAGGIGSALARRLATDGFRLALVDLDGPALDAPTSAHVADVSEPEAWSRLAGDVEAAHGPASWLVNNAGITVHGRFADMSLEDLSRVLGVNLAGVMYGCRAFLPQLERTRGHVVNLSSLAGVVAFPMQSTYSATKFGVRGFSAALRAELAPHGVGVTAVLPGTIATGFLRVARSYHGSATPLASLMQRFGTPPSRVADRIVRAVADDRAELVVGWDAHLATAVQRRAPSIVRGALGAAYRRFGVDER